MNNQLWSWILTAVGVTGFILAGRKVWWCWWVNLFCQILWFAYAVYTDQYGFVVGALVYSIVFSRNAVVWTQEHQASKKVSMTYITDEAVYGETDLSKFYKEGTNEHSDFTEFPEYLMPIAIVDTQEQADKAIAAGVPPQNIRWRLPAAEDEIGYQGTLTTYKGPDKPIQEPIGITEYEVNTDSVEKRNRHSAVEPLVWYGPSPEPNSPGPDCDCVGCTARFFVFRK